MMTLGEAHALLPGSTLVGDAAQGAVRFQRVHSDTRSLRSGDLFVALRGDRFDANDFIADAMQAGAVAALAERGFGQAPGVQVQDSLQALQQLAAAWRSRFDLPFIAVTGSNGKTTVTQMIASILRAWHGDAAFSTVGNLNNHIGVPLTLLRLREMHKAGVVELGMNHPGEIALLSRIAAPGIALVNNAQREHQEFMATVEAVARENGAVIDALPASGTVVLPVDDTYTPLWQQMAAGRNVKTFALDAPADVSGSAWWDGDHWEAKLQTRTATVAFTLSIAGRHNVKNALAAAACALAAGAPLAAVTLGLREFKPVNGRSAAFSLTRGGQPVTLIDDSYNANPDSVIAAIDVLAALPAPRWLLLGDMGEVGDQGPAFHAEIGAKVRAAGIEHFWAAGTLSAHAGADRHFATTNELVDALPQGPAAGAVLIKGSRFMKMERAVEALKSTPGEVA